MIRHPALLLALVFAAPLPAGGAEAPQPLPAALRIVPLPPSGADRGLLFRSFAVLEDLGDFLVTAVRPGDPPALEGIGAAFRVIQVPEGTEELYVVSLRGLPLGGLEGRGHVLHRGKQVALIAADGRSMDALARPTAHPGLPRGIRPLNRVPHPPLPRFVPPAGWRPGTRAADPRIQAMVDQVDEKNLQAVVQDLQDMGERKAASGAFVAETYLVNSYNALPGLTVTTHHFSPSYADNVIAELPGTVDPSVIVILGSHYDSTSGSNAAPGADDNASGTAAVREAARILSAYPFKYTLRFVAFNAEELGLVGSDAYCDLLVSQGANVAAMINQDMNCYRAAGDARDVDFVLNYSSGSLIAFCKDMYATYVPGLGVTEGNLSGGTSDHQSFTQHGYPACFPFEDLDHYSPYIHSSNDVIGLSANDFTLARMITQGVLAAAATLASPVDLEILHDPLPDTTDASGPYAVEAAVHSLIGTQVTQVTLFYDTGGGFASKVMVPEGAADLYLSSIPGKADPGEVRYYLEAQDDQGNMERLPGEMGEAYFQFYVGHFDEIFGDDFELGDNGWTHGGTGQDDWMRGEPTGNGGYDPDHPFSGAMVWGNDLGPSGWNGNYKPNVDNWLRSPAIDCSGQTGVVLRYRRWLTVQDANHDQARILVNGNEVYKNPAGGDLVDTEWVAHTVNLSPWADNNPDVRIRFTLTTDGSVEMGGWNIDDLHVGVESDPDPAALAASEVYVQASTGGTISFHLAGGASLGGRAYVVAASASGTDPGTPIGSVVLPLNWDALTNLVLANLNTPLFSGFLGTLDGNGEATAAFNPGPLSDPAVVGLTIHFAWITLVPVDYASNAVGLLFVP